MAKRKQWCVCLSRLCLSEKGMALLLPTQGLPCLLLCSLPWWGESTLSVELREELNADVTFAWPLWSGPCRK